MTKLGSRVFVIALSFVATLSGCSLFGSGGDARIDRIYLTNSTESTIYVMPVEETVLHRIDLVPSFDVNDSPFSSIDPSGTRRFDIDEIDSFSSGDNLGIVVYSIPAISMDSSGVQRAVFTSILNVLDSDLRRTRGRVVIDE